MRVYLPATLAMIQEMVAAPDGSFGAVGGTGFALTPALREAYVSGDDEELEEVALREAARASLRLLGADESDLPLRRVVVVADAEATVRPDLDDAVVKVAGPVAQADIVAVHVDGVDHPHRVQRHHQPEAGQPDRGQHQNGFTRIAGEQIQPQPPAEREDHRRQRSHGSSFHHMP